jgi:RHS repeat-associated protein
VLVFNSAGSVTNRYLQGPGVDQVLADEQVSSASQTPNTVLWALSDNQGTVRDWAQKNTTTGQTQIVDHIVYDAYGQIVSQTNPQTHLAATNKIRFGYTGQIWDADAKLYYYRARWYDPHIGKFTSEDPLGFAAGDTNVQRYVGNSPTNATDPSGLKIDENNANGFGYFHVYSSAGWFQDGKWIATISYKLTGPNSDSDRDLAYALAQRIDAARTAEAVYKIVHNGVHQGIDMGLRTAFEPLDFVLSAGEFIQKPTLANALQIVPFTPAIVRNVQELRGALRNVGNLPNVSPSMLSPTPGSHTPPVLQPGKTSCPNLDKSNVKKKPEYNSTSGKPPKTPDNIGAWLPYTEQQLLQMLVDRTKTPSAKDILAALKDGSLQVVTDPTLIGTVKKGGCNSGNVISIRPGLNEHDLLTTLIHEGQHAMDIRAGMPLFENASLFEKAKAEARAFGAEIAYMEANSLVKASQWNLTKMGAREAWISIANSYPDFMALSDAEFIECIGILNK